MLSASHEEVRGNIQRDGKKKTKISANGSNKNNGRNHVFIKDKHKATGLPSLGYAVLSNVNGIKKAKEGERVGRRRS